MKILITGGYGYIGSHIAVSCLQAGHDVIVVDDLSNSKPRVGISIDQITGKSHDFVQGDITDRKCLDNLLAAYEIDVVIHCAARKAVGESCEVPSTYYHTNIAGTTVLLDAMQYAGINKLIFSSSTTVYDTTRATAPFDESMVVGGSSSPYGTTKVVCEMILRDAVMHRGFGVLSLRYFNPVGAHPSGLIGEDPSQPPQSLLPIILQTLSGHRDSMTVYGRGYDTPDGTCLRDYIHVCDVAQTHVLGIQLISDTSQPSWTPLNIGTGTPTSVLEMIRIVQDVTGMRVPYELGEPRSGDVPVAYASTITAKKLLGWEPSFTITQAVKHAWTFWQQHFGLID